MWEIVKSCLLRCKSLRRGSIERLCFQLNDVLHFFLQLFLYFAKVDAIRSRLTAAAARAAVAVETASEQEQEPSNPPLPSQSFTGSSSSVGREVAAASVEVKVFYCYRFYSFIVLVS